jgi:DNA polymerase phi
MASGDDLIDELEESSQSDSSENHTESDVEVDENETLELRRKIEEALRVNGIERASSSGSDDDSEEEELLDDDQMMQFDEKLAEVFRMHRTEKGKGAVFRCLPR